MPAQNGSLGFTTMPNAFSGFPPLSEIPPFDPTNPVALFAMAAAFGLNISNMPGLNAQGQDSSNVSCSDYDTKGYCAAGSICPYQHGGAIPVPADKLSEYDPRLPIVAGQGNDQRHGGGRARASFSNPGPTRDRTNTTLVVEQIPQENFTEEDVRQFFSNFGTIIDVQMQTYKRLAIIKYDTHDAAKRAYNSPKAVFDNRFVKVYWHKSGSDYRSLRTSRSEDMDGPSHGAEEALDPEEIRKRQAGAQKSFEDRQRKAGEATAKAEEIERKLQETNDQILKLKRDLAAKSRSGTSGAEEGGGDDPDEDFSQDLATLQAEAEDLFAQQDIQAWQSSGRGRGGYHGHGAARFPARGGYSTSSFRGGYRGRGGHGGFFNGHRSGVKRLDNRPRRIAVANIEPGSTRDEALRQHLIVGSTMSNGENISWLGTQSVPDCSIEPHPQQHNSLIVTFQERYQAEMVSCYMLFPSWYTWKTDLWQFLDAAHAIPDVGKLELSWAPTDASGEVQSTTVDDDAQASDDESAKVKEEEQDAAEAIDVDMDVADDVDQWL
jgi:RNA recognition motif-containing protein